MPACPEELTSPLLPKVLSYHPIQSLIFGGKGVGSQGDGSAQLVAVDQPAQQKIIQILSNELKMSCLPLTLMPATAPPSPSSSSSSPVAASVSPVSSAGSSAPASPLPPSSAASKP